MKIYAIATQYEAPYAYYTTKTAAQWAIDNLPQYSAEYDYVEEIEVIA